MKKLKGANLEDGCLGEQHFGKGKQSYGVFTHSKVGGAGGVEGRKSRTDAVRWIKGG